MARPLLPLLLLATGCTGALVDPAEEPRAIERIAGCGDPLPAAPTHPVPSIPAPATSRELVPGGATFADIAHVPPGGACSDSGYATIDSCYNRENPPAPSVTRRVGRNRLSDASDHVALNENFAAEPRAPGDLQQLPIERTSTDGRLVLIPGFQAWPRFEVLRPETIGPEGTVLEGSPAMRTHNAAEVHPLAFFNPLDTAFVVNTTEGALTSPSVEVSGLISQIDMLHSTLCDGSTSEVALNRGFRNPVPCTAFRSNPAEVRDGVCYRVTLLGSMSVRDRSELRSAPLTVFVPNAYRSNVPDGQAVWVYPANPAHAFDAPSPDGVVDLPAYEDYDLAALFPWDHIGGNAASGYTGPRDLVSFVTSEVDVGRSTLTDGRCYIAESRDPHDVPADPAVGERGPTEPPPPTRWVPNPDAPPWCEFVFGQRRAADMFFDADLDTTLDRGPTARGLTRFDGRNRELFELAVTGDGRVLFINGNDALYYSVNEVGACRADGFRTHLPISFMPIDPLLLPGPGRAGYGMARATAGQPFQDPSGRPVPFGSMLRAAYQWVDRRGDNLFLAVMNEQRDEYRVDPASDVRRLPTDATRGTPTLVPLAGQETEQLHRLDGLNSRAGHHIAAVGAWTGGRFIVQDNLMNASDLGGAGAFGRVNGVGEDVPFLYEYALDLYRDRTLRFIPVGNPMIGSFENRFNYLEAFAPVEPFDVVWEMQGQNQTRATVIFDDWLDRRALVVAHMNASLRFHHEASQRAPGGASRVAVENGFVSSSPWSDNPDYEFNTDAARENEPGARVVLQNATAFSTVNNLRLRGGARVEPVALGGVRGRGVYLDGINDFIDMGYPIDTAARGHFLGVWLDPRLGDEDDLVREVFHFSDGSYLGLRRLPDGEYQAIVHLVSGGDSRVELGDLIQPGRFTHVGLRTYAARGGGRILDLFIDGTRIHSLSIERGRGMDVMAGSCGSGTCTPWTWMALGAPAYGRYGTEETRTFRGWVDELHILTLRNEDTAADSAFEEQICNLAFGSLVDSSLAPAADRDRILARFQNALGVSPRFACEQLAIESIDEPRELPRQAERSLCASRAHHPGHHAACVRASRLQLPTLEAEQPRPSSGNTSFCLTCHVETSPIPGLRVQAPLAEIRATTPRWRDARRQPMNAPPLLGLPPFDCAGWSLEGTLYEWFPHSESNQLSDGTWSTDHVFDDGVAGQPPRLMPPSF